VYPENSVENSFIAAENIMAGGNERKILQQPLVFGVEGRGDVHRGAGDENLEVLRKIAQGLLAAFDQFEIGKEAAIVGQIVERGLQFRGEKFRSEHDFDSFAGDLFLGYRASGAFVVGRRLFAEGAANDS